ncbi:MAG: hypothetical protein ACRDIB_07580, partial [Ardenticatenaceae bacterium]
VGASVRTLSYHYAVDWRIPRSAPLQYAFPVQVQAYFPERGDRRTLELLFVLTGWMPTLNPFFQRLTLRQGPGMPAFSLLPVRGRPMMGGAPATTEALSRDEIVVEDLAFEQNELARLLVRLDEELPASEEGWLHGEATVGFIGSFSGMKIEAFYDSYGHRVRPPRGDVISRAVLCFKIDVAALPYQSSSTASCECYLPGLSVERDDAIIQRLETATRVVYAHEQMRDLAIPPNGSTLPPVRDITGHWLMDGSDPMAPVVYNVHLSPTHSHTKVAIRVETPVTSTEPHSTRAADICDQLTILIGCQPRDSGVGWDENGGQAANGEEGSSLDTTPTSLFRKYRKRGQ